MQQQRCLGISVSVGQTTVLQTTQQLAAIRVGDVEIADVDDMSIGDACPFSGVRSRTSLPTSKGEHRSAACRHSLSSRKQPG
jgi:hypothetical protein